MKKSKIFKGNMKRRKIFKVKMNISSRYLISSDDLVRIKAAEKILGIPGRMLYPSKSMRKPTTIFNAYVFTDKVQSIWIGDIEIERDREKLIGLSKEIGTLYIMLELEIRLQMPETVERLKTSALVIIDKEHITFSDTFKAYMEFWQEKLNTSVEKKEVE